MPDSMAPVANDISILDETVVDYPPDAKDEPVGRLSALVQKKWFPYAATGLGVLAIYFMRKKDVAGA